MAREMLLLDDEGDVVTWKMMLLLLLLITDVDDGSYWRQAVASFSSPQEVLSHLTVAHWPLLVEDRPFSLFFFTVVVIVVCFFVS